jgi:uncharacterized membrane protein YeaQ/YmgE (transglycosylase-associated protein family)
MHDSMGLHNYVWFLVVGGLAGWIASVLVQGRGMGIVKDVFVGIIGAFCGGFFADQFRIAVYGFWQVLGMSVLGSVILLVIFRVVTRPKKAEL